MTIQTDDFQVADLPPSRRVMSAAPESPREEAIERALRPAVEVDDGGLVLPKVSKPQRDQLHRSPPAANRVPPSGQSLVSLRAD